MNILFKDVPHGEKFYSQTTGLPYIKILEGHDIYLDLDFYKVKRGEINAICIHKELAGRPACFDEHLFVDML